MPAVPPPTLPARLAGFLACATLAACTSAFNGKYEIGIECGGDDARCLSGLCFEVDDRTSVCSRTCTADADCPENFLCEPTPGLGSLCLPIGLGGRCATNDQCPAGHRCDLGENRCYLPVSRELCAPCTASVQCPAGGRCQLRPDSTERYCTAPCGAGDACPAGFTCDTTAEGGPQCLPDNPERSCDAGRGLCSPCRGNNECGGGEDLCVRNLNSNERFCGRACLRTGDCPDGFNCLDLSGEGAGPFQCVPNSATCVGYCDSSEPDVVRAQCGLGRRCDLSTRTCVAADDGRLCAPCGDDDGCPEGGPDGVTRCTVNNCPDCPWKGEKFCATECTPGGPACPAGFFCAGIGAGGAGPYRCVPNAGTCTVGVARLGEDCTARGAAACASGLCLGFGRISLCGAPCSSDAQCGDGRFRCCAVTGAENDSFDCAQPPGAAGGVCSPRGGAFGADCSAGQPPCFEGVCLDLGTARLCSRVCDAATACPADFACRPGRQDEGDGTFTDVSVCFPDGGGDLGADCSFGPAACQSGLCLKKDSGNICTRPCDDGQPCADNWSCTPDVTTVDGASVQVCIPDNL
jgi:hypothetical protein